MKLFSYMVVVVVTILVGIGATLVVRASVEDPRSNIKVARQVSHTVAQEWHAKSHWRQAVVALFDNPQDLANRAQAHE